MGEAREVDPGNLTTGCDSYVDAAPAYPVTRGTSATATAGCGGSQLLVTVTEWRVGDLISVVPPPS